MELCLVIGMKSELSLKNDPKRQPKLETGDRRAGYEERREAEVVEGQIEKKPVLSEVDKILSLPPPRRLIDASSK